MYNCPKCQSQTIVISRIELAYAIWICPTCKAQGDVDADLPDPCQHLNITSMQQGDTPALHICTDCKTVLTAKQARAECVTRSTRSQTLGESICKVLNLDAGRITSLRLTIGSGLVPLLEVNRAIFDKDVDALRCVLEQYQITPIPSAPQAADPFPTESN